MLRATWRSLLQHKLRLLLSGISIVLGVGFVVGTFIFTDTLDKTFTDLFTQTTSDVVVTIDTKIEGDDLAGSIPTLPADAVADIAAVPGVEKVAGVVFADGITIVDPSGEPVGQSGAPQFGSNWEDDEELTPLRLVEGVGPSSSGEVAIDSVTAEDTGYELSDTVRLITPQGESEAELVGIFRFGTSGNLAGATIAAFDNQTAQELMVGGEDAFTEIDVVAAEGVTQTELASQVRTLFDGDVLVQTGQEAADEAASEIGDALKFVNIFLLVFAGIALFVGTFIILNTFSMLVVQRTKEMALLRAVGATRGQVTRSVLAESLIVGLIGSLIGLAMGVAVAYGLQALFAAIGAEIPTDGLTVLPRTIIVGVLLGVVITVLAAYAPARRASRIPPVAALRDDATIPTRSLRARAGFGIALLVVGAFLLVFGVQSGGSDGSLMVGIGTLACLLGAIVISPVIAGPSVTLLGALYPKLFGSVGQLAVDNAARQPRRTAATASALMIGLALVSALTIFAASASASINQVIDQVIGSEFLLSNSAQRPFPEVIAQQVADVEGVGVVSTSKFVETEVENQSTFVTGVDPASISDVLSLEFADGSMNELNDSSVLVDSLTATNLSLDVGDDVDVQYSTGPVEYQVGAIYEPAGFFTGYVLTNDAIRAAGVDIGDAVVYVNSSDGADLAALRTSLDELLAKYPTVELQSQAEFKDEITGNVNQLLLVMLMLLSLAIVIAVLGIVNTLVLSVIERTREIGMLRAVGALRSQIRYMVVLESVVIAFYGAIVGLVLGVVFAVALQRTLVDQGIQVLSVPWPYLVIFLLLAAVVGVLAALWPAYRAGKLDVLRAITTQ